MKTVRASILLPKDLADNLRQLVGNRKRTKFIIEATREKLQRLKFSKSFNQAIGVWTDANHPDLKTQEDVNKYLKKVRLPTNKRISRIVDE